MEVINKNTAQVAIRWMLKADMRQVQTIEQHAFTFPWTPKDFRQTLVQRSVIGLVAELADPTLKVVGFLVYEIHPEFYRFMNLAVHQDYRGRGVGRQLIQKMVDKLNPDKRRTLLASVYDGNLDAQKFFSACGFWATRVLPEIYDGYSGDAYEFELTINQNGIAPFNKRKLR